MKLASKWVRPVNVNKSFLGERFLVYCPNPIHLYITTSICYIRYFNLQVSASKIYICMCMLRSCYFLVYLESQLHDGIWRHFVILAQLLAKCLGLQHINVERTCVGFISLLSLVYGCFQAWGQIELCNIS